MRCHLETLRDAGQLQESRVWQESSGMWEGSQVMWAFTGLVFRACEHSLNTFLLLICDGFSVSSWLRTPEPK